jgi:hypothetical protein
LATGTPEVIEIVVFVYIESRSTFDPDPQFCYLLLLGFWSELGGYAEVQRMVMSGVVTMEMFAAESVETFETDKQALRVGLHK